MARGAKQRRAERSHHVMTLAIAFDGDSPPSEFRIFRAGENESSKGVFLFDDVAARAVMAAFERHGADLMIDLEHLSLESTVESRNFDPDARGWGRLAIRNGELWAVQVKWTPDGEARLREKRQRYISPAFEFDSETKRVTSLLNIAITALPATDRLAPLVAANAIEGTGDQAMTPEQFTTIAEALGLGPDANVEDVIATIAAMVKKVQDAANGTPPDDKAEGDAPPAMESAAVAAAPPVVAASKVRSAVRALTKLSGKRDVGEIVREVEAWRASHLQLEGERAKLAQDRALLEGSERRRLVGELVKLGAEIPATAWADLDSTKPAEPWASMGIDALRARVAKLAAAKGSPTEAPKPAPIVEDKGGAVVNVDGHQVQLSSSEVRACRDASAKIEDYAANKLIRMRANGAA